MDLKSIENIVSLCKRRGFIFQSSEIYGGLGSTWDYGPYGVEMKQKIKDFWWHDVVTSRENVVGMDAAILMHPKTWEASGHVSNFHDPLVDCKNCKPVTGQIMLISTNPVKGAEKKTGRNPASLISCLKQLSAQ